jgi:hypothetical protein
MMHRVERVAGIGGVFFRSTDPKRLAAWYAEHLGIDVEERGGSVFRADAGDATCGSPSHWTRAGLWQPPG